MVRSLHPEARILDSAYARRMMTILILAATTTLAAAPDPCKVLPVETWNSVMGATATAIPGDGNCSYNSKTGGGQFRIIAVAASPAEAEASAKRMQEKEQKGHHAGLGLIASEGATVFSIALFQKAPTEATAGQLQKLAAAIKQGLSK